MGAYLARDQDLGREPRTVREFISEFRGLTGTAKQKAVLAAVGVTRVTLPAFFGVNDVSRSRIEKLLAAMQQYTRPVKPKDLGIIGEDHLRARFAAAGADDKTFPSRQLIFDDDLPQVIECAFGHCPKGKHRRIVTGVNWSPGINNPFRTLGRYGETLDTLLAEQRAGHTDRSIGLGTLAVRDYLGSIREPRFEEAGFAAASIKTFGPRCRFGAVLFIEKEGFMPALRARPARRALRPRDHEHERTVEHGGAHAGRRHVWAL
jgi:hypothetical protein